MLIDEIAQILADSEAGLGSVGSTIQRGGFSANAPDTCLAVFEYPGESPLRVKDSRLAIAERPRFQIVARAKSMAAARMLAEKAHRFLDGYSGSSANGVRYQQITALQNPFYLDHDDGGRARIACNYRASKELSPIT